MFGTASDKNAAFVSAAVGTNMVTLTFGLQGTGTFANHATQFGSFVLLGTNVEGITSSFTDFTATSKGTGVWGGSLGALPTVS